MTTGHLLAVGGGLLAAICWTFAGIGWARYFKRRNPQDKLDALQELAPVMAVASLATAAAFAGMLW